MYLILCNQFLLASSHIKCYFLNSSNNINKQQLKSPITNVSLGMTNAGETLLWTLRAVGIHNHIRNFKYL